jgi:environmental stress-induced protein Ves
MTPAIIAAYDISPQAWRNGGGQTRELWTWPAQGPWQLRISRADISADGPFSAYPGVTRWFAVLHGHGVALTLDGARRDIRVDGEAVCFDGAQAPDCTLLDGPTQDLNLMTVGGASVLQRIVPGQPWTASWTMRGLYTTVAGHWHRDAQEPIAIDAHSLLWLEQADAGAWSFRPAPDADGNAWWLGFTPEE